MYAENFTKYLPEIFQQNGSFLDRFLSIFSTQYLELEKKIDNISQVFDLQTAPHGVLRWLAEITHMNNPQLWSGEKLRELLSSDIKKGTRSGLRRMIEIFTSHEPFFLESTGYVTVLIPQSAVDTPQTLTSLKLLIEGFLPKDTGYSIEVLSDTVTLSRHTYLGINTVASEYPRGVLNDAGRLEFVTLGG